MAAIGISRTNVHLIKKKYQALGKGNVRLTQSTLRLIRDIDPTKSSYVFPVLENETTQVFADEIRLAITDEFTITSMGIYLKGTLSESEGKATQPYYFTWAPVQNSIKHAVSAGLYDGLFRLGVNNINYIEKWAVKNHEYTPAFSQFQSFITPTSAQQPSSRYLNDAKVPFSPLVSISGAKKQEISISLPKAIDQSISSFVDNQGKTIEVAIKQIAVVFDGMLAQNSARFQ